MIYILGDLLEKGKKEETRLLTLGRYMLAYCVRRRVQMTIGCQHVGCCCRSSSSRSDAYLVSLRGCVCVCAPSSAPIQTTLLTPRPSSHRLLGFRGEIITSTDPIYNGESIKTHWHWYRILLSIDTHSDVAVCDGQDQYIGL